MVTLIYYLIRNISFEMLDINVEVHPTVLKRIFVRFAFNRLHRLVQKEPIVRMICAKKKTGFGKRFQL